MSQLKFTQIQDMFILLSKKVTNLETAMKDLGEAVADVSGKVDVLEEKEAEREEKEATHAGEWKNLDDDAATGIAGSFILKEIVGNPNDTDDNTAQLTDDTNVGEPTYTLTIKEIPKFTYTLASGATAAYKYALQPTEDVTFDIDDSYVWPTNKTVTATVGTGASAKTLTYTFAFVPANGTDPFKFEFTCTSTDKPAADEEVIFELEEPFEITGIKKKVSA